MKALKKYGIPILFLLFSTTIVQCSKDELKPENMGNPDLTLINDYIAQFPDWIDESVPVEVDSIVGPLNLKSEEEIPFNCVEYRQSKTISTEEVISVGTNFGKIWPGALIEGNSIESGDLKIINNIERAPITINTNLPITQTYRVIENPNSVTVQQAIAEMQTGIMPNGATAGAGLTETRVEEYSTYLQAMISMGVNGGFTIPETPITLSGDAGISIGREQNTQGVMVKYVQKAFTIRLADDLLQTPSDFFADTVTLDDIKSLESNGTMSSSNVPLYIESVTYGRLLFFTLTSTTASTYLELKGAVEASFAGVAEGGANLGLEAKAILATKSVQIFSAGGSKEGADAVVADLDYSKFFVEAPTSTAVPISFVARTLNGKKKVILIDNAVYSSRGDCVSPRNINIEVKINNIVLENPKFGTTQYQSVTFKENQQVGDLLEVGKFITGLQGNTYKADVAGKASQLYSWEIENADKDIDKVIIRSANRLEITDIITKYPFREFNEGSNFRAYKATNNSGEIIRFEYSIKKSFEF